MRVGTATGHQRRGRRNTGLVAAALVTFTAVVLPVTLGIGSAAASGTSLAAAQTASESATAAPDSLLQNEQVVTVSWSGMPQTSRKVNPMTQYRNNDIAILECAADPPGGIWYFFRDCYTAGENLGGNIVAPSGGIQDSEIPLEGSTGAVGTGAYPFQVQEGTLETQEVDFPCGTTYKAPDCNQPYSTQCDIAHPCVLKVIPLPDGAPPIPNELWQGPPSKQQIALCAKTPDDCTYSQLIDAAPSVSLDFGPLPDCPAVTAGNLPIEGAASSSYALESWAADLCGGSHPVTISYSDISENVAKSDLLSAQTDVAVAAIAPTAAQIQSSSIPGYIAAPLDAAGVSIVFNMVDPLTGLPIGCSANQPVSQCATPVRLTPRLMAMLITNSATFNAQEPFGHLPAYTPPNDTQRFIEPLTDDPEFQALNPGFQPPAICTKKKKTTKCIDYVEEPVLRAEDTDDTYILTQWIADDYDAQRFLAGDDPCGAQLNRDWQGVAYPSERFEDLAQTYTGTTPDSDSYYPEVGTSSVLQSMLYGVPVGGPPPSNNSPKSWLPAPTDNYAFFGVMDTVSAHRSGLPSAELIAASPKQSELASFVSEDGHGGCTPRADPSTSAFVPDDDAGLAEAYKVMTADSGGTLVSPVETTDTNAYPLAKIDYALVPSSGLPLAQAKLIATLLRFSAGPGQTAQYLPPGYPPLPPALKAQAITDASKIVTANTPAPIPPTSPPTTVPQTSTTVKASAPPVEKPPSSPPPSNPGTPATTPVVVRSIPPVTTTPSTSPPAPALVSEATPAAVLREGPVSVGAGGVFSRGWLLPAIAIAAAACALLGGGLRLRPRVARIRREGLNRPGRGAS